MNADRTTGQCLCGAVRLTYTGSETWACHCHCDDCRRSCAAPRATFLGVPFSQFEWCGDKPVVYSSSPGVRRLFSDKCETLMAFQAEHYKDETHFYAATLSTPETFDPKFHAHHAARFPWPTIPNELPRYEGYADNNAQ
ncbi:MAG: GFA family protein [Pseudoruegeria sp.]